MKADWYRQSVCVFFLSGVAGLVLAESTAVNPKAIGSTPSAALNGAALFKDYACNSCHGEAGRNGLPGNPVLAGQDQRYLIDQLFAFKRGLRVDGMSQAMKGTVATVPDDELIAISVYLSAQDCR
jgi:cytochrome c553